MKKSFFYAITLIVVLTAAAGLYFYSNIGGKKRVCPDQWYENRMPFVGEREFFPQYFVIEGQRAELEDYDVEWIRENCEVNEPQPVY